ncbi:hypothetical protein A2U01_0088725 [Trifolium medium]|uniref:Uncharacterized protein n=1 Tax=Trifolium medium TaxID=97028 RepID=A0A392U4Z7_9FABA|nr:hypothetical protein [Trifolium medium]
MAATTAVAVVVAAVMYAGGSSCGL